MTPIRRLAPCLAAALLASCGSSAGDGGGSGREVVFGLVGPMRQDYGASTRRGAELAMREINGAGGINGDSLRLVVHDDGADAGRAITIASELVRDASVVALAGPVNSGTTLAAASIYNGESDSARGALPVLATTATSPEISRLGDWIFRVASSDSANAVALAQTARAISPAVAVLYTNDEYGRGLAEAFRGALEAAGGTIPESDPYFEELEDFTPYLRRMQARGVRMVFIAGLDASAERIIRQARGLGMEARFIGGDGLVPLSGRGALFNGTMVGLMYHRDSSPAARRFADAFRQAYGADRK